MVKLLKQMKNETMLFVRVIKIRKNKNRTATRHTTFYVEI